MEALILNAEGYSFACARGYREVLDDSMNDINACGYSEVFDA